MVPHCLRGLFTATNSIIFQTFVITFDSWPIFAVGLVLWAATSLSFYVPVWHRSDGTGDWQSPACVPLGPSRGGTAGERQASNPLPSLSNREIALMYKIYKFRCDLVLHMSPFVHVVGRGCWVQLTFWAMRKHRLCEHNSSMSVVHKCRFPVTVRSACKYGQ